MLKVNKELSIALDLPDYLDIIQYPMDLKTVKERFEDNKYTSLEEILDEIQLIWDNCKNYNMDGSVLTLSNTGNLHLCL